MAKYSHIKPLFYYFSQEEWARHGYGPLPQERDVSLLSPREVDIALRRQDELEKARITVSAPKEAETINYKYYFNDQTWSIRGGWGTLPEERDIAKLTAEERLMAR